MKGLQLLTLRIKFEFFRTHLSSGGQFLFVGLINPFALRWNVSSGADSAAFGGRLCHSEALCYGGLGQCAMGFGKVSLEELLLLEGVLLLFLDKNS